MPESFFYKKYDTSKKKLEYRAMPRFKSYDLPKSWMNFVGYKRVICGEKMND